MYMRDVPYRALNLPLDFKVIGDYFAELADLFNKH